MLRPPELSRQPLDTLQWLAAGSVTLCRRRRVRSRCILEQDIAGKVEAVDHDSLLAVQGFHGSYAEPPRNDSVVARWPTQGAQALLFEFVHGAFIVPARGKHPLLAFKNDCQVGGQLAAGGTFGRLGDAEHHAPAPAIRTGGACEADANSAAVRPWAAVAFQLRVAQAHIEHDGAADAGT
jgi:hypothetical protein